MDKLNSIFQLREVLRGLERDVGLDRLNTAERDILLAAYILSAEPGQIIESNKIRRHKMVQEIPQATFHRALKSLLDLGVLERSGGTKAKKYVVRIDLMSS